MPVEGMLYPVNLVLAGRRCLVVGGGPVAVQKAAELVVCGADVHVVAPAMCPEMNDIDGVIRHIRPYEAGEVADFRLAITATDDPKVNRQVFEEGEAAGVWVNSADDPANCAFTLPSRVRQGPILLTFATGGHSPAMATWFRRRFSAEIGPEYLALMEVLSEERTRLQEAGISTEGLDWQGALDSGMLELVREGRLAEAKERLQACLS
ncbi:MAG: bifunctional precorrin-2 dehydrogenase/sirohydrochlorin ferrochelatase [Actinobacteria bacterium]|nr:bifunctional precorrin-2 dehydrogenase/sirohydrochlorin ferrochelatase [Actinomycetota bacterium]